MWIRIVSNNIEESIPQSFWNSKHENLTTISTLLYPITALMPNITATFKCTARNDFGESIQYYYIMYPKSNCSTCPTETSTTEVETEYGSIKEHRIIWIICGGVGFLIVAVLLVCIILWGRKMRYYFIPTISMMNNHFSIGAHVI